MTIIGCGLFDDPNYGLFDVSWFDCISLRPNLIKVSDLDLNKSDVSFIDIHNLSVKTSQLIKPMGLTNEQKKSKVHMSKEESIVKDSE